MIKIATTAPKFDRRQFLKISALATTSGALMGTSENRSPIKITDKCQRMDQKNTIFARQLWDHEFVSRNNSAI